MSDFYLYDQACIFHFWNQITIPYFMDFFDHTPFNNKNNNNKFYSFFINITVYKYITKKSM